MTRDELRAYIGEHFEGRLSPLESGKHDPLFEVAADNLLDVMQSLKSDEQLRMDFLCNLGGVDTGEHFEVVYNLASIAKNLRLDIKVVLPHGAAEIESVQNIWPAANWYEREMWELYGINVLNHGNLTRFLLPEDWDQGHPLRKDWSAPDFEHLPEASS